MPFYNLNIRTKSHIADTVRTEQKSLTELRREMAQFVGKALTDHADAIWIDQDWQVNVTDERGLILYIIDVSAAETSATVGTVSRTQS